MEIVGKKLIEAPLEKVWGNLNNLNVLQNLFQVVNHLRITGKCF